MLPRLLDRLPLLASFEAVPAEWRTQWARDCFERLPTGYLANTRAIASSVPCRNRRSCRRHHLVEETSDGRLVAYCPSEEHCAPFEIPAEERVVWRLDLPEVFRDFAETLSVSAQPECLTPSLWRLGTFSKRRIPVLLSLADTRDSQVQNAAIVGAQRNTTFVFFVATDALVSQPLRDAIDRASGRLGALTDHLTLDGRRRLVASLEITDRWGDLAHEPTSGIAPLRVPPGTPWADVVVQLADRETIKISTRTGGDSKTFTRDGLGLNSQRNKLQGSKRVWDFLVALAERSPDGIDVPAKQEDRDNLNNRVRELNKLLRRLVVGVPAEAPIRLSRKKGDQRYRWTFKLSAKT